MNHNLEIQKLLLRVDSEKHPEDQINLLKQAIQIADANNDLDWGFDLRIDLIRAERDTTHCKESFPAFAWLLNTSDSNPDMFDESDFLWEYKWMAGAARRNTSISKQQVESIMDDLRNRMEKNGYTLRGYYSVLTYWYIFIGDINKAKESVEKLDATSRDRMSHCPACELDTKVEFELMDGNFDKALSTANDLITKKLTCGVMPLTTFCNFTYWLNKANDPRAEEYFTLAEEEIASKSEYDTSLLSHISDLLPFLIKNNKAKAWEYFEKYADWGIDAEDSVKFDFAKNILPLLKEGGIKKLSMSDKLPYYNAEGSYKLEDLYNLYYKEATEFAQLFDQRNETNALTERLEEVLQNI